MKRFFLISLTMIIAIISCDKEDHIEVIDKTTLTGTWNEKLIKKYNAEGDLISEESLDTIRLSKLSISDLTIQEMLIDTANSFFFLMYKSYVFENGVLKQYPDSLLDIDMNKYYWNEEDSTFGTFPILAYPFESTIVQTDNNEFIESRVVEGIGGLDIFYNRTNEESIDLKNEFDNYSNNINGLKTNIDDWNTTKNLINNDLEGMPVYNTLYK